MKLLQKYITNVSALQFVQLLRFSTLFLIGVVFVRFYSTEQIGYFETLIFIAGAVSFFWLSGILQSFLALLNNKEFDKPTAIFNSFLLLLFFSVLAVLLLLLFQTSMQQMLNNNSAIPYFKWLLLYILFSSPSNFIEYIYLSISKPKRIIVYGLISYGIQFIALATPSLLGLDILYSIMAMVVVFFLRFVWLLFMVYKYATIKISFPFIKKQLVLAYPLMGSVLLSGSAQYIDGFIVTHFYDEATFAIFRYGAREFPIAIVLSSALSNALIPEFSILPLKDAVAKLKRNVTKLIHLLFPLTYLFLIFSNWMFPAFFNADFAGSAKIFNVYLLLIISRMLLPHTILIGLQQSKLILWSSFVEIVLNVILSYVFIQWFGLIGVAFATVIAYYIERLILIIALKRKEGISLADYLPVNYYMVYSLILLVLYVFVDYFLYL